MNHLPKAKMTNNIKNIEQVKGFGENVYRITFSNNIEMTFKKKTSGDWYYYTSRNSWMEINNKEAFMRIIDDANLR